MLWIQWNLTNSLYHIDIYVCPWILKKTMDWILDSLGSCWHLQPWILSKPCSRWRGWSRRFCRSCHRWWAASDTAACQGSCLWSGKTSLLQYLLICKYHVNYMDIMWYILIRLIRTALPQRWKNSSASCYPLLSSPTSEFVRRTWWHYCKSHDNKHVNVSMT